MNYKHGTLGKDTLRILIGFLGLLFPFLLIFFTWFLSYCDNAIMDSISSYYHTPSRPIFMAVMLAVSYFFIAFNGYDRHDFITAKIAAISLFLVAVFPTDVPSENVDTCHQCSISIFTASQECKLYSNGDLEFILSGVQHIHYASAAIFFLSLAYFSLVLFPKSDSRELDDNKKYRNWIYRVCGITILVCLILIVSNSYLYSFESRTTVFWLETVALFFFGLSWIVKSQKVYGLVRD